MLKPDRVCPEPMGPSSRAFIPALALALVLPALPALAGAAGLPGASGEAVAPLDFGTWSGTAGSAAGSHGAGAKALELSDSAGVDLEQSPTLDLTLSLQPESKPPEAKIDPKGGDDSAELAKKLSNPVASLISVPFQFNYDTGYGPRDAAKYTLNIQPVIPFSIAEEWNLIVRTIVPVIEQEAPADGEQDHFGLGDTLQSFFFSPKEPVGGWILGAGPAVLWPTGTSPSLRSESLGLGPTIVLLRQDRGWTYGALANHIWSVTNSEDHEQVNQTFVQPFISYTWSTATTLVLNSESTYDWSASQWTVPVNLAVSQIFRFGRQPVQFQLGGRYYADSPDGGPEWGLRFAITFLFPK